LAARTAVVAGTANAVNARAAEKNQYRAAQQQAQIDAAAQSAVAAHGAAATPAAPASPPAPPAAPAADGRDVVAELQKLGALRDAGLLDDAEFSAAKAKVLG